MLLHRRAALFGLICAAMPAFVRAENVPQMTVYKDPNCGCCGAWVDHVKRAGIKATVIESTAMDAVKKQFGVPDALTSCHTAEIGGYVIEGHVPAAEILRLLSERPAARGLAVADMPTNSPGMEVKGAPDDQYDVMLFSTNSVAQRYATYRGAKLVG